MKKTKQNYQGRRSGEFGDEDFVRIAEIAEFAIIKWVLEISDNLDIPIAELADLRKRLKEFLDEEVY